MLDSASAARVDSISLASRRGQVTIVHFWTYGCYNCQNNLPAYARWHKQFAGRDVVVVGIHTPETSSERASSNVVKHVKEFKIEYPVLFHCKSGADRAGFLAALYMLVIEQVPVPEARKQLSLRFWHIKQSKTGILDAVFDAYLTQTRETGKPFLDWVREDYDPETLKAQFRHGYFADLLDRFIFRHE